MIKTLSPYYITIPLVSPSNSLVCNSYILSLYIWGGSKAAVPATATYTISRINQEAAAGNDRVNIARIVNDFIEIELAPSVVTSIENGDNQRWVKWFIVYDVAAGVEQLGVTTLATKGYGYFLEGENPQIPANKILIQGDEFKVNRNGLFCYPFKIDEV